MLATVGQSAISHGDSEASGHDPFVLNLCIEEGETRQGEVRRGRVRQHVYDPLPFVRLMMMMMMMY